MTDFAANIHFRASAEKRAEGVAGGYAWFLGRFADWSSFETEIRARLTNDGYVYFECTKLLELTGEADLNEGEQRQLYGQLNDHPIQSCASHIYKNDDA